MPLRQLMDLHVMVPDRISFHGYITCSGLQRLPSPADLLPVVLTAPIATQVAHSPLQCILDDAVHTVRQAWVLNNQQPSTY